MSRPLKRLLLDTNIFIIGAAAPASDAGKILAWAGYGRQRVPTAEIIFSEDLLEQIRRVARRIENKDWAGEILSQVWFGMNVHFVMLDLNELRRLMEKGPIPREDVGIYLTALAGEADCFVSTNRSFVRAAAAETNAFECLSPGEFVAKYLI
jgi:predicted nucleic acid-binding protein